MSSVAVIIDWISGIRDCIDAVNVIDVSITVVIDSIGSGLSGIYPDVFDEIRMVVLNACIDDKYDHIGTALRDIPTQWKVHRHRCVQERVIGIVGNGACKNGRVRGARFVSGNSFQYSSYLGFVARVVFPIVNLELLSFRPISSWSFFEQDDTFGDSFGAHIGRFNRCHVRIYSAECRRISPDANNRSWIHPSLCRAFALRDHSRRYQGGDQPAG